MLIDFIKDHGRLDSPLPIVVALVVGAVWLWWRRASVLPRVYVALLAAGYWFVATPFGANLLLRPVAPAFVRIETRDAAGGRDTVVLLGGGIATATVGGETAGVPTAASLLRALESARVFKIIGARLLIASGGMPRPARATMSESALLRRLVIEAGVPADRVVEESRSTTTAEQARDVRDVLQSRGIRRIVVVTSPAHMKRALALFRVAGFEAIGSMAPMQSDQAPPPPRLLPNEAALAMSDDALYEYAALTYYWVRGRFAIR